MAFLITGVMDVIATAIFLTLYRDAPGYNDYLVINRLRNLAERVGMVVRHRISCP